MITETTPTSASALVGPATPATHLGVPQLDLGPVFDALNGTEPLPDPPEGTWANQATLFPSDWGATVPLPTSGLPVLLTEASLTLPTAAFVGSAVAKGLKSWAVWASFESAASTFPQRALPAYWPSHLWEIDSRAPKSQPDWVASFWKMYPLSDELVAILSAVTYDVALAIITESGVYYQQDPLQSLLILQPLWGEYKGTKHHEVLSSFKIMRNKAGFLSLSRSTDACLELLGQTFTWKAELASHALRLGNIAPHDSDSVLTEEQWAQVAGAAADQHQWDVGYPTYTHLPSDSSKLRIQLICEAATRIDDFHDLFRDLGECGTRGAALWYYRQWGSSACREHYLPQLSRTIRLLGNLLAYAEVGSDVTGIGFPIMYTYFKSRTRLPAISKADTVTLQTLLDQLPSVVPSTAAEEFPIPAHPGWKPTIAGSRLRMMDPAGSTGALPGHPWPERTGTKVGLALRDSVAGLLGTGNVSEKEFGQAFMLLWHSLTSDDAVHGCEAIWWLIANPVNGIALRCCAIWRILGIRSSNRV